MADLLERLFVKTEDVGLIEGFCANEGSPVVPFIQFVDNSLFLLKADMKGLWNLRCILLILRLLRG